MDQQTNFREFELLFWELSGKMENLWKGIYAQTFPGSQSKMMYVLQQEGPKKMSELAHRLHITAGAVTTAADILIDEGYITRIRDRHDRRVVKLEIAHLGHEKMIALQEEGRKITKEIFSGISEDDLRRMNQIFQQASHHIDELPFLK